jgi:hypoxanthine-DNA glycosylase
MARPPLRDPADHPSSCSFPPLARADARILVLGTLPGERSLALGQYYGHQQNRFWAIAGSVLGFDAAAPYDERVAQLLDRRIALWDVCAAAVRPGSLDASIRSASAVPNDFATFFAQHPAIVRVCFNGQHAAKLFRRLVPPDTVSDMHGDWVTLPSTSPANAAMTLQQKRRAWAEALLD